MEKIKFYTLWLALACILVFIIQIFFSGFTDIFLLNSNSFQQPWRFITAIFLHGSFIHLLYNLFALIFFGLILEKLIGSKRLISLFLLSGVFANIISFWFYPSSLGASGAIMAIIGVVAVLRPMMAVWSFGMIMPMFILALLWVLGSFLGIFGFGDQGTGHIAHLSGIFIGLMYGLFLRARKVRQKLSTEFVARKVVLPEDYVRAWENHYVG